MPGELGRTGDLVLGFGENLTKYSLGGAECTQRFQIMHFQFGTLEPLERRPCVFLGNSDIAVVWRPTVFIRHF